MKLRHRAKRAFTRETEKLRNQRFARVLGDVLRIASRLPVPDTVFGFDFDADPPELRIKVRRPVRYVPSACWIDEEPASASVV